MKVAVSGGFDPLHIGHVRLFKEARKLGTNLTVIINNDNWLRAKKGYVFMPENDRKEIIESLACVDEVIVSFHEKHPKDASVCSELETINPDIFANGGDRKKDNVPEIALCKDLNIRTVFNIGGDKIKSSSKLIEEVNKE